VKKTSLEHSQMFMVKNKLELLEVILVLLKNGIEVSKKMQKKSLEEHQVECLELIKKLESGAIVIIERKEKNALDSLSYTE